MSWECEGNAGQYDMIQVKSEKQDLCHDMIILYSDKHQGHQSKIRE